MLLLDSVELVKLLGIRWHFDGFGVCTMFLLQIFITGSVVVLMGARMGVQ